MTLTKSSPVSVTWSPGGNHASRADMSAGVMAFGFYNTVSGDIEAKAFEEDSPLSAGSTATVDTGYTANEARLEYIEDGKGVIAWQDGGALYAAILTYTGTSISAGAVRTVKASGVNSASIAVSALGTGALIFGYLDTADSDYPKAVVCTISGTTISAPGTAATLESVGGTKINIAGTSSSGAIAGYNDADFPTDIGRAVAMTISGTTITVGTPANITGTWLGGTDFSGLRSHDTDAAIGIYVATGDSGPSAKIFSQSGTTLSQGSAAQLDYTGTVSTQGLDVSSATLAFYSYHHTADGILYAGEIVINGTAIDSVPSALAVVTVSWETQIGAIGTLANGKAVISDTINDDVYLLTSDLVATPGGSGVYAIALSNDVENDGTKGFLTLWRNGTLYLQKWDLPTLTVDFEIPLGAATLDEVQARTRTAYPFALSDQEVFLYGAMDSPAYLSGIMQLILTSTGGASGTWSDQSPGTWGDTDILAAFYAGADSGGGRPWYGVRCTTGTAPAFWYGTAALSYESVTPLLDGTIIRHGAFHISRRESAVVGADYGEGSTLYTADPPLWATWQDFTYDHPSGSHGVLRFF